MVSAIVLCVKYNRYKVITTDTVTVPCGQKEAKALLPKKPSGVPRLKDSPRRSTPKRSSIPVSSRTPKKEQGITHVKPIDLTPEILEQFEVYSKFGDKGGGQDITLQNLNKWLKQARIIDGRTVTITDTAIFFKQVARTKRSIEVKEFQQFTEILIRNRKLNTEEFQEKLLQCGTPKSRSNRNSMSDDISNASGPAQGDFKDHFKAFSKFGDSKSTGDHITLSNIDKWFKQAKIIDGKKVTTVDTGIYFKQKAKTKRNLTLPEFDEFLQTLCKQKKLEVDDVKAKLVSCGAPSTTRTTAALKGGAIDRLTDHKKFTGTHKQRFDDAGKGKGKDGRVDSVDKSGYVSGYKDKNTYDTTH